LVKPFAASFHEAKVDDREVNPPTFVTMDKGKLIGEHDVDHGQNCESSH